MKERLVDSGIEWIGLKPQSWPIIKLKNFTQIFSSNVDKKIADDEEEVSLCNYVNVYYNDKITLDIPFMTATATEQEIKKFRLQLDDVVVTKDSEDPNDIAVPAVVSESDEKLICGYHLSIIRANSTGLTGQYLFWALKDLSIASQLHRQATGITRWAISRKHLKNVSIPHPGADEQTCIAQYLDQTCAAIDHAIAVKQQQLDKLDQLRKSIIYNAVTKGLDDSVEMRDSGLGWCAMIPSHWSVSKLKRVFSEVDYGISESTSEEGRYAVLKMGNLVNREIAYTKIEYVPDVSSSLVLDTNDLLFNRTNSHDQVAKVGIFRGEKKDNVTFASYLVRLRVGPKHDPEFLNYLLNTEEFLGLARKLAIPSVQQANLNPTRYGRMEICVPAYEEQKEIREFLDTKLVSIRHVEDKAKKQIEVLNEYKKSLIHECVTGKRRITEADLKNAA